MKTLILSDLHLGTDASSATRYLDGIRAVARHCDRVILNGDTLDRYEARNCTPDAERLLKDALEACASRNGPPELISGNHDPAVSGEQWIYDAESATLVFHGDCIADCTHPTRLTDQMLMARLQQHWKEIGGRPQKFTDLISVYRRIQAEFAIENPPGRVSRTALEYVLSIFYPPQKPFHILRYWAGAPRLAAALGETFDKPLRHLVVGHTHRAGCWKVKNFQVINTGSFMPLSTANAAVIVDSKVNFVPIETLVVSGRTVSMPAPALARRIDEVQA
ncbi:MAG TPA: metallophosphoesterase [Planctomycetota bacterium]|nr:metallophosphoesterase [Planctomycetota bacterium]